MYDRLWREFEDFATEVMMEFYPNNPPVLPPGSYTFEGAIEAVNEGVISAEQFVAASDLERIAGEGRAAAVADAVDAQNDRRGPPDHLESWHRGDPTDAEIHEVIDNMRDDL